MRRLGLCLYWCSISTLLVASAAPAGAQPPPQDTLPRIYSSRLRELAGHRVLRITRDRVDTASVVGAGVVLDPAAVRAVIATGDTIKREPSVVLGRRDPTWATVFTIPEDYVAKVSDGQELAAFRPVFLPSEPMRFDPAAESFRGELMIVLEDMAVERSRLLSDSVSLEVVSSADFVDPRPVRMGHLNFPPTRVRLIDDNPRDSVRITFITETKLDGFDTYLAVEPALILETRRRTLQGLGLQSIALTVTVRGAGFPDSVPVRFDASLGSVEPEEVFVRADRPASARLRSESLGGATVRALSVVYGSAEQEFRYAFPYPFLLAALLGGLIGALVAYLRDRRRRKQGHAWVYVAGGVLWGLIAAVAYGVLGLNVIGIDVAVVAYFNEGVAFVLSALAASRLIPKGEGKAQAPEVA